MREVGGRDQGLEIRKASRLDKAFEVVERVIGGEVVRMSAMAVMGAEMLKEQGAGVRGQGSVVDDAAIYRRVGARIYQVRKASKVSGLALAARSGVHRNTINRIEDGTGCNVLTLWKIARALDVRVDDLLCDSPHLVQLDCRIRKKAFERSQGPKNTLRLRMNQKQS